MLVCLSLHIYLFLCVSFNLAGDCSLNFNEFLKVMAKNIEAGDTEKDIEEAFRIFDKDGNGFINHVGQYEEA